MAEFKKSGKRRNVRKREKDSSESEEDNKSLVVMGDRRAVAANPLKAASCSIKKLKAVSKFKTFSDFLSGT